jgi:alpha-L-fucosidase 2
MKIRSVCFRKSILTRCYDLKKKLVITVGLAAASLLLPAKISAQTPFGGTPAAIPGTIQNENYDTGGQGVAYNVTSINGQDPAYRSDGVDLENTADAGGGDDLGWTSAGQWFKYTVNVATAGTYTVSLRVASATAVGTNAGSLHLQTPSGTNLSGAINVPGTGGWQTWTTITATVTLPAGQQVIELFQDTGGYNLNYMTFASPGIAPVISSPGTASGTVGSAFSYQITASHSPTSYGASGLPAGLSVNASTGLISGTPTTAGTSSVTLSATNASGTGNQALTLTVTQQAANPWELVGAADFNGDGKPDLIWQNTVSGQRAIWPMNGTTYVSSVSLGTVTTDWDIAGAADFNGDGKPDLIWQNTKNGQRAIWLMNGTTYVSSVSLGTVTSDWQIAGAADFNKNGNSDLIWQNTKNGQRAIWLMNGATYVSSVSLGTVTTDWQIVGAADLNGDGNSDLIWQNTVSGQRAIWLMNGTTYVSTVSLGTVTTNWNLVGAADFNGDGKPDLIWQDTASNQYAFWLMNGTTYVSSVAYTLGLPQLSAPSFNPAGGTFTSAQNVTISDATSSVSIRYTTDGSTPSETNGTLYSGPVNIGSTTTLKAIAYANGYIDSPIDSATYTITTGGTVAPPTFNPPGGTYTSAQSVTIATTTSGASIRYTTDGSAPTETSGTIYLGSVSIGVTTTLKAIAYESGMTDSNVSSATYMIGGGTLPSDVLAELNNYNVVWTSPSTTGSAGSMPIGNGDITANVWVESGGDLVMYIGKSDTWSEGTRLLKVGRMRIHLSPNPFTASAPFSQTLNYYNGEIDIAAGQSGSQVSLRIYIDANQPVVRVAASGQQNFTMSCTNEIWRNSTQQINNGDQDSFRGVSGAPTTPSESADQALSLPDRLVWYHQNASSYFSAIFNAENLSGDSGNYTDPWAGRIFGATILAPNFNVVNNQQLQSSTGTSFLVSVYPYTSQAGSVSTWQAQMNNQIAQVAVTPEATARANHYAWWDSFWNRSWIFVSGDANATSVTSGYLAQRFTEACQGRGQYPIKFNGGTFTFDHNGQNGDFRAWGPGYWNQNTRLLYWPMLASGDFDTMKPFFNIYMNMLPLQTAATNKYYGHGGAFFPETFNIFGLYYADDWYWNNGGTTCGDTYIKYHYSGGLETLAMMLTYYDYTQDNSFASNYIMPMATQAIRFFNEHWSKSNGKLVFYPANACEMYWSCTNPTDYIAGLQYDIQKLLALPGNLTTPALVSEWQGCLAALPPLPMDSTGTYIKPAQTYGSGMNSENPECYCIFPYRLYGIGLPNFNTALATFNNRTVKNYKFDWSQDPIEEALVGLTNAAQTDVINNFKDTDSSARYQAFWATRNDYVPSEDTGGAAMSALQYMLMQCVGSKIMILPAWPATWDVDFKLNAPENTSVRLVLHGRDITQLTVIPASRASAVVGGAPIQAASYNSESGVQTENCSEGGLDVGYISNGSYTVYNQVDLAGFTSFDARVASNGAGGNIEIHLDSPTGTLIGTCAVPTTGGWQTWGTETCSITPATGSHNVYLVYTGSSGNLFNVEWFTFGL